MHTNRQIEHVERITNVMTGLKQSTGIDGPDELIRRSWLRCTKDYGLDPSRPPAAPVLTDNRVRERQQRIEQFMRVARSGMEQLYTQVAQLGYSLMLSDSSGVTLDRVANPAMEKDLRAAGVYIGAAWKEIHAGTSGIGIVIEEKIPVICHQGDHFDMQYISLSCAASPIFDPLGELLAVLNIAAAMPPMAKDSQQLALQLTKLQAKAIEDANFIRHFEDQWILRLGQVWPFHEVNADILLALDDSGVIVGANTAARRELSSAGRSDGWIVGCQLSEVFDCSMEVVWRAALGAADAPTLRIAGSLVSYYLTVRLPRRHQLPKGFYFEFTPAVRNIAGDTAALDNFAGDDPSLQRMLAQAKRILNRKVNVLIRGDTGTGKEVLANALHKASARADKPFIALNCAAIPESLIESELFGYTPGSFTGGRKTGMKGLIAQSDQGTLFLDEIGDMPLHLQSRLLRVLSEGEVTPIGADKPVRITLNVIAATHRDLRLLIKSGNFREDLYYRLCGTEFVLPPLRDRKDIDFIIDILIKKEYQESNIQVSITDDALAVLKNYSWPGNIREMRNAIRYASAISENNEIRVSDLPREIYDPLMHFVTVQISDFSKKNSTSSHEIKQDAKVQALLDLLWRHKWNITAVAEELGVYRTTVYRQMKRFQIVSPEKIT